MAHSLGSVLMWDILCNQPHLHAALHELPPSIAPVPWAARNSNAFAPHSEQPSSPPVSPLPCCRAQQDDAPSMLNCLTKAIKCYLTELLAFGQQHGCICTALLLTMQAMQLHLSP